MAGQFTLPFDFNAEQDQLKRRQALLDQQAQGYLTPEQGQMVSGHYVAPGIAGALAKVLGAYFNQQGQEKLTADNASLRTRYNTELGQKMNEYLTTRSGVPGHTLPEDQAGPQVMPVPGDPRKAAIQAVTSGFGPLQQIGMEDLKAQDKNQIGAKDLLPYVNPTAIPGMLTQGLGAFKPKANVQTVGDVAFDANTNKPIQLDMGQPTLRSINGDLYQSSPTTNQLKKLDNAPNVKVNVGGPVIQGQKAGMQEYFKGAAKQVEALGQQANASQELLNTLGTLKQLHQAGINSNITSDMATAAANLGQQMGLKVDVNKLGNTETYNSLITDLWQRSVAKYGGNRGVTQSEADEIKKLTPMARTSPQAREMLFSIYEKAANRSIGTFKQANDSFARAAAADDPRLFQIPSDIGTVYTPPAAGEPNPTMPQSGGPIDLDQYLLMKRGGK